MDGRGQFTFYRSYYEALKELPRKEREPVLMAIIAYALDGESTKLTGVGSAIFSLVKPTLDSGRKKAESGKQGGSKAKANAKQTEREKEREGEKEKEREGEKEKENECSLLPPVPPSGGAAGGEPPLTASEMVDSSSLSPEVKAAVHSWLSYKKERREAYKEQGFKALLTTAKTKEEKHGSAAVVELITQAMANRYAGIMWDRLERGAGRKSNPRPAETEGKKHGDDLDRLERLLKVDGGKEAAP